MIFWLLLLMNIHFSSSTVRTNFTNENVYDTSVTKSHQLFIPLVLNEKPEYYVASNGSDTNPGTFLLPWKTIGKAAQMVAAGDTVFIRGGLYHESVSIVTSGTLSHPIKIMAYPGENPVIEGGYTLPGYWGCLLCVRGDYIIVSGIEVRNSAYMGVFVYGSYDLVKDMYVHHCMQNGILINHGSYSIAERNRVWRNAFSNEYGDGNGWSSGLSAARDGVSNATIRNNIVWENWGEGISTYEANGTVIEDNISHDNYSANIYISDSTNVLCQRNMVYMNPDSYVYGYGANGGIMMGDERFTPPSANITIINNIAFGNHNNFWWWQGVQGGGMNNVLIAFNSFVNGYNGSGVTISEGIHQNVRFENNLVQQDGELPVIATIEQTGITYSHNLWSKPPYNAAVGPGDVIGDPLLAKTGDPFEPDWYRLIALSPAVDQALSISEVIVDYFGFSRDSAPDIGAIEYLP